jgi:hypothetical protein
MGISGRIQWAVIILLVMAAVSIASNVVAACARLVT